MAPCRSSSGKTRRARGWRQWRYAAVIATSFCGWGPGCSDDEADRAIQAVDDDDGGDGGDATEGGAETGGDAGADGGDTGDTADSDASTEGGDAATDGSDASAAETPVSVYCGDGIRDPLLEECDDGLGSSGDGGVDGGDADADEGGDVGDGEAGGPAEPPPERRSCTSSCLVLDLLAMAESTEAGPSPAARTLGIGRHPLAGGNDGFAVAFVEPDLSPMRVSLTAFDANGTPSDVVVPVSTGTTALHDSNPVLGAVGDGRYYAAWTDFDGDGDEQGVAIRIVDPVTSGLTAVRHANSITVFSQHDPDLLAGFDTTGSVVIAWVDDSSAAAGPDVRARLFDRNLLALGPELVIASTAASEADVALAPFHGSWAVAWKSASAGLESMHVKTGALEWHTEDYLAGPSTSRPAIAELDATHLLLVFAGDDGAGGYEVRGAVLDTAAAGAVTSFSIAASTGASASDRRDPNVIVVGSRFYVAWRAEGVPGEARQDELWLKAVTWSGSALGTTNPEIPLPRWPSHRAGDQRHPALAGMPIVGGDALIGAWDDLGKTFGLSEGNGDVVLEMIPLPLLRLGDP
jgi:hypothetical protein